MKLLLRLKHWQLFLLTWGVPIIIDIYTINDPSLLIDLFPMMITIFTVTLFSWIWAISTELNKLLTQDTRFNLTQFKLMFLPSVIYIAAIDFCLLFPNLVTLPNNWVFWTVLIPIHIFSIAGILYGCRLAGQVVKSIELGRQATTKESRKEYGQVSVSFIGIWTLQPKLNKIITG
jgi:hypothetical protein